MSERVPYLQALLQIPRTLRVTIMQELARLGDEIERLEAENKVLRHDFQVLMDCWRHNQRCHECPDTECCDNTREEMSDE